MLNLDFQQFEVLIGKESNFSWESVDNPRKFNRAYRLDDDHLASLHSVRVRSKEDLEEIDSCILGASGGATAVHEHSAIINQNSLVVAVGPFMVSLRLPMLEMNWKIRTDAVTCFGVYCLPAHRCFISHGELEIARVSYDGKLEWQSGGADILTNGIVFSENTVRATDFYENIYEWDIETGNLVGTTLSRSTGS
jgi:hypothetical protein